MTTGPIREIYKEYIDRYLYTSSISVLAFTSFKVLEICELTQAWKLG